MTTKKTAAAKPGTLKVAKTIGLTISNLGARTRRELAEDLQRHADNGYHVASADVLATGAHVMLQRFDEWSVDEFIDEIESKLAEARS
ncbi:hypothetical protein AKJ09_03679 [Labilithrix luteola]|uniref:Uncharacterized protein n=1 Tax=Labilithrix luteola TaxID=1391654 RepID=A0A0K1PU04_9BACT|nr:hypothetical protein [Labilithrix luteola]AKU97015.1 hypothetical protein AKJ09_03679 [Labilithrix luteola]